MAERTLRQQRAERLRLEEGAMNGEWEKPSQNQEGVVCWRAAPDEVQTSIAISLKRLADQGEPVNVRAEDVESDPLMIIARAMEEIAKPTLPQESDYQARMIEIAEREAKAIENILTTLKKVTSADAVRHLKR